MNLTSFDYYADTPDASVGFERTATLIREARQQATRNGELVVLLDNGDSLQGTPLGEWSAEDSGRHPLMHAFEVLEYDAIGLGNHDFSFGLKVLDRVVGQASCPVICSNARRVDTRQTWQNYAILDRIVRLNGRDLPLRIGVFSVLPPQTAQWEAHRLRDRVQIDDILGTAHDMVSVLQARGADMIIALAHSGIDMSRTGSDKENAVVKLAEIDGIDAIVAGHSHLTLPGAAYANTEHVDAENGRVHGKPVVMPGSAGSHLGIIDMTISYHKEHRWQVQSHRCEARPIRRSDVSSAPQDAELSALFQTGHRETRLRAAEAVGNTQHVLHSYFCYCAQDRGLNLVAAAQAAAVRLALAGTKLADAPVLSAAAPVKFGGRAGPQHFTEVPAGQIRLRHISDLHVFPNELRAVLVTGSDIAEWLEMSAGLFHQIGSGQTLNLIDPDRAGFNFDVLHGITYQFDLTRPARFDALGQLQDTRQRRVTKLCFEGQPIRPEQRFVVALNNYRASGGGNFPVFEQVQPIPLPAAQIKDVIRDYVSGRLARDPLEDSPRPFRISPSPGAHAVLKTGPGALAYLDEVAEYAPQPLGQDDAGFELIRLSL